MHLESCLKPEQKQQLKAQQAVTERITLRRLPSQEGSLAKDKELQEIFERTYGKTKRERQSFGYTTAAQRPNTIARARRKSRRKNICWWTATTSSSPGRN